MQLEAATISSEQASQVSFTALSSYAIYLSTLSHVFYLALQAMEQRYNSLATVHTKLVADKERLGKENESLREVGANINTQGWEL